MEQSRRGSDSSDHAEHIEIEFHDDGTMTASEDIPYVMVLELTPIPGPDNWSVEGLRQWVLNLILSSSPKKILLGIILLILAFIINFLRIKINRGDEEIINVTENIEQDVEGAFSRTMSQIMSFFGGFRYHNVNIDSTVCR